MGSIATLYQADLRFGDSWIKPLRECRRTWHIMTSSLKPNQSRVCQVVIRVLTFIPLVIATLVASLLGVVGICLKGCTSKPREDKRSAPPSSLSIDASAPEEEDKLGQEALDAEIKAARDMGFSWIELEASESMSFKRSVFISKEVPEAYRKQFPHGIVVKLSNASERSKKGCYWPFQEEIAFKLAAKLFGWEVVPKTKVMSATYFQTPLRQVSREHLKYQRYRPVIQSLGRYTSQFEPATFTIQAYTPGISLRKMYPDASFRTPLFQQACLLDMIFNKSDDNPDNYLVDLTTGRVALIDNEFLGYSNQVAILFEKFPLEKDKEVLPELLDKIISLGLGDLAVIKAKYDPRDQHLFEEWLKEPLNAPRGLCRSERGWTTLLVHFNALKAAIEKLRASGGTITMSRLRAEQLSLIST